MTHTAQDTGAPAPDRGAGERRRIRLGLSGRLTLALAALATLTAIAAATAIWGMEHSREGFDDFAMLRYRQMTNVTRLLQSTERLAAAAPRLITIRDRFNLQREKQYIADLLSLNNRAYAQLQTKGIPPHVIAELTTHRSALVDNLTILTELVETRLAATDALEARLRELSAAYLPGANRGDEAAGPPSPAAVAAGDSLNRALPYLFKTLGHDFPAEIQAIERQVAGIMATPDMTAGADGSHPALAQWRAVRALLEGGNGFFAIRLRQLALNPRIQGLLLENSAVSGRLSSSATNLFVNLDAQNTRDRDHFERLLAWGRGAVLGVTLAAVLGAGGIFLVMRRRVVARLGALQQCMADNAAGIPTPVPTEGADEISDMAHSLEIFVRSLKEQKDELRRQASIDAVTGLRNRRSFFVEAEEEFERFRRYGGATAVMMLDLDHFKTINDTCGHAAGDRTLRRMADVLREVLRGIDTPGRIGGEEFAVLLPATAGADAVHVAERVRQCFAERPVADGPAETSCTVSIGIAVFSPADGTFDDALHRADEALYLAKQQGRNRVAMSV